MENYERERKGAFFDKRTSKKNYVSQGKIPDEFKKRITSEKVDDIETEVIIHKKNELVPPPKFSGDQKKFKSSVNSHVILILIQKIFFNERAKIIANFDKFETIDLESSLVNLNSYFSKFNEDEASKLTIKDIFTFDIEEFDNVINKINEFKSVGEQLNDKELVSFFEKKIKVFNGLFLGN